MSNTKSSIPTRYDPRVIVEPCDPARVPYLPPQILYLIARALPQPKSVFNLALSSKETWEYLQPALFECEVTYESRLGEMYGGRSSDSLKQHFGKYLQSSSGDSENDESGYDSDESEKTTTSVDQSGQPLQPIEKRCQHHKTPELCDECGERIRLENRTFESPLPDKLFCTNRRLTALHWACIQGSSALPVALKAIRSALTHQPSYIDGIGLRERLYPHGPPSWGRLMPADLPSPLSFAVAYGNVEACKALVEAGCNVNLLQGQNDFQEDFLEYWHLEPLMAFKLHNECSIPRGGGSWYGTEPLPCVCLWDDFYPFYQAPGCQTAGHVAVRYEKSEILGILLRGGLDVQKGLVPLINYAVAQGNVAAVKILLEHDPSLFHRRAWYRPLIQAVPFMRPRPGHGGTQGGRVREMIEYLLGMGADLDSRSDTNEHGEHSEMTALQTALNLARACCNGAPRALDLMIAAEVFIRAGASWNQPIFSTVQSEGILEISVLKTVGISSSDLYPLDETDIARALETRKGWGRVVKAMIETTSHSRSDGDSNTVNGANLVGTFYDAFAFLVNFHRPIPGRFGPWGTEAVGRLLLSTGITPSNADMEKWETLCLNREAWTSEDGDKSQWEFLLAGIDDASLKTD